MKFMISFMFFCSIGLAESRGLDFNKEINQISSEQFAEHLKILEQTKVTEAAVEFENAYRKPSFSEKLNGVTIRIMPK